MIALVGSGEYLPPIEPVDRFLLDQLSGTPRVVCLPTAAGTEGAERIQYWSDLGERYFQNLGVEVRSLPVIDQPSANDPDMAAIVQSANYIYLSGGHPNYLLNTIKDSLIWQMIQEVLAHGGLLAGCSAGAMIMGERIPGFPRFQQAFNLVPGTIVPHFDEVPRNLVKIIKLIVGKRSPLIGIEGSTALFVKDGIYRVIGAGRVTIWNNKGEIRYSDGQILSDLTH
jgi:cyanophycinase